MNETTLNLETACNLSPFTIGALARLALNDPTLTGNARTYARPYLEALMTCDVMTDYYGAERADMLARYALSNLTAWRGTTARAFKAEVNARLRKVAR